MPKKDTKTKAAEKKLRTAAKASKKTAKSTAKASKKPKASNIDSDSDDESTDLDALLADYAQKQTQFLAVSESPCPPPSARSSATLTPNPANNRELLLFGGESFDGSHARFYNDLIVYHTRHDSWSLVTSPNSPLPRSGHAWCVHHNSKRVYLFGGEFSSPKQGTFYHYADFWALEPGSREWSRVEARGKPPSARSGHRMVAWRGYVVLFGGFRDTAGGTTYLSDVYVFDTGSGVWWNSVAPPGNQRPDARSSFSFLPHEGGAVVYGGYSRVKSVVRGKSGAGRVLERPVVHQDSWVLRITPSASTASEKDGPSIRWEKRKKPANAPNPPRAGVTMAAHKGRGISFGGVWDTEGSEEGIESEFFDELGVWNVERNRVFKLGLRRPRARKDGEKGRGARRRDGEEELLARLRELEAKDGGGEEEAGEKRLDEEDEEELVVEKPVIWEMPHPRFNAQLAVQDDVVYIYGGTFEKGDKEFTFDEMWAIDLGKLDGCKEIFRRELPGWGVEEEEEQDDEEDEDDDEEGSGKEDKDDEQKSEGGVEVPPSIADTTTSDSTTATAPEPDEPTSPSPQDTLPHPRPFESLRAFHARTSETWQTIILDELGKDGDVASKSIKEVRKEAFERAEEKWWDCREEIQALEDEREEAGIGEVVNLGEKGTGAGVGVGRRR